MSSSISGGQADGSPPPNPSMQAKSMNGKASAAAPQTSTDNVELKNMTANNGNGAGETARLPLPVESDIMQLARLGEIGAMQKLFDTKKFNAKYKDEEGITPLHWAAINNQYAMCRFLLDSGADVNAKGGESVATPAMWAAQRCHYYIVDLLLQRGADPLLTDVQGYNILHLATIDGNAYLVFLLLHQGIPVDIPDPQGHTGLMWAAYKGLPVCVDLFLRWGANVNAVDEGGLAPLHWALVKGSYMCVQKVLEYGADRFAKTRDGKSPATVASEMRSLRVWHRALNDYGYDKDGNLKTLPMGMTMFVHNKSVLTKYFFLWPFLTLFIAIWILSNFAIYIGIPVAAVFIFGMHYVTQQVANNGPGEFRVLQKTPYLAGVFAASLFWVNVTYIFRVLPVTWSTHPVLNVLFSVFAITTTYFYIFSMAEDPGYVPKLSSRNQQRETMRELVDNWKFNEEHFCIHCMVRKPLRSKHCRRCSRCVAKHDHHCPWIYNCVGANNLRHFVIYILSLEIAIVLFVQLVIRYIELLPAPKKLSCNIINDNLCTIVSKDTFTLFLTFWAALQLVWVTMLCCVQLVQISRNQTTYENMRGSSMTAGGASQAITSALVAGTPNPAAAGLTRAGHGPTPGGAPAGGHGHQHHQRKGGFIAQWMGLLGLDTFFATAQGRSTRQKNPFSRGIVTNCRDFWFDSAPIFRAREPGSGMLDGAVVDYYKMYEPPLRVASGGGRSGNYVSVAGDEPESAV
ncbi:palmitoyltransferase SidR [Talaromyces stipitatus ATCC 10500]|uniref:Palmitoyltransferase n=1 Tax=Talaromyces stipitatus (strain ATCC 10500 / CBS 375.48 / QM 6759 / NRRL 1006) TaxID=441959 RepID=B8M106_TALSN|nr:palmitoyltransferase SidR [Talaromyces stipitatus ATCC 10500]EED21786.1 palmitoyltransferase SidR [Talaromyces stipitatus ATCC 10500]